MMASPSYVLPQVILTKENYDANNIPISKKIKEST
jgi:hypothetical protein